MPVKFVRPPEEFEICGNETRETIFQFVPRKFVRPPEEFQIYGNETRQTILDSFVVPFRFKMPVVETKKKLVQKRITDFFVNKKF